MAELGPVRRDGPAGIHLSQALMAMMRVSSRGTLDLAYRNHAEHPAPISSPETQLCGCIRPQLILNIE